MEFTYAVLLGVENKRLRVVMVEAEEYLQKGNNPAVFFSPEATDVREAGMVVVLGSANLLPFVMTSVAPAEAKVLTRWLSKLEDWQLEQDAREVGDMLVD